MSKYLTAAVAVVGAATAQATSNSTFSNSTSSSSCPTPLSQLRNDTTPIGSCAADLEVIGNALETVHEGDRPPTGIAVDPEHNIFFTYARNMEDQVWTLTKATGFTTEEPWPTEEWQNCEEDQDASTCFVNVQNIVLDSEGGWWVIDSGVPHGE